MILPSMATSERTDFEPYIPEGAALPELTVRAVLVGTVLGIVFGASSLYLALKVGLTVSASIPVAVISVALYKALRWFGIRDATVLEHNIAQTAGSAGESLAFGVGVTMPAVLILGFDLEVWRVTLVALLGGLLGILMMIPLRRALIVQEHGVLKYPEGTACAEVIKAGACAESRRLASPGQGAARSGTAVNASTILAGFGIGMAYKLLNVLCRGWKDAPERVFGPPLKGASISAEISPELLGVGYVIGPRIAGVMAGGGVLSYLVLIPMIKFFGEALSEPLAPGRGLIREMGPGAIRNAYVLYIGAGAVAAGGLISLVRSLPTIWKGLKGGLAGIGRSAGIGAMTRTDRDLSPKTVAIGLVGLMAAVTLAPPLHMNLLGAALIVVFGFLFVTVSSRLTGEIGSSSNPISGMTIATLLLTCLIFLMMQWTGGMYYVTALSVGAVVCIASSNGGTTSQDLKTGHLLGGTPRSQQLAILVGAAASAMVMGPLLLGLNQAGTVYVPAAKAGADFTVPAEQLAGAPEERVEGVQAGADTRVYKAWHVIDPSGGNARKFLVDAAGKPVWLVDPGVNGQYRERPDGSKVDKYDAPKALLVSYIIKGILDRKLPWALVLLGVMIAVVLELSGIPALAFAVGVYLPISISLTIFVGGVLRWLVDRHTVRRMTAAGRTEQEISAETDRSPGILMASGYIAGASIAGVVHAFLSVPFKEAFESIERFSARVNPFYEGPWADGLSLLPFGLLCAALYLVARERWLAPASEGGSR